MDRPTGCRFWEAADIATWVEANTTRVDQPDPAYSALWWLACINAEFLGEMNFRERAHLFMDGITPMCAQDVDNNLQAPHEDGGCTVDDVDKGVERELRTFFGVEAKEV